MLNLPCCSARLSPLGVIAGLVPAIQERHVLWVVNSLEDN
jgi:hypothetical protein